MLRVMVDDDDGMVKVVLLVGWSVARLIARRLSGCMVGLLVAKQ